MVSILQCLDGRPTAQVALELLYQKMRVDPQLASLVTGLDVGKRMVHQCYLPSSHWQNYRYEATQYAG